MKLVCNLTEDIQVIVEYNRETMKAKIVSSTNEEVFPIDLPIHIESEANKELQQILKQQETLIGFTAGRSSKEK